LLLQDDKGQSEEKNQERSFSGSMLASAKCAHEDGLHACLGEVYSRRRAPSAVHFPSQVWRLTSGAGDVSVWATGIIRAGDFAGTDMDVRDMPFPRIGTPDDPNWAPHGLTWKSLGHPVDNFRKFLNLKWNNSRRDVLVFLGLKQPPWASDEMLTVVAAWAGVSLKPEDEAKATDTVLGAFAMMLDALRHWKESCNQQGKASAD
jgi:hypothetical protein